MRPECNSQHSICRVTNGNEQVRPDSGIKSQFPTCWLVL